jgi:hypothetical protein
MAVNAHRAFDNSGTTSYRANLKPSESAIEELRSARDKVRYALQSAFCNWEGRIDARVLFEDMAVASFAGSADKPKLSPKFRGQGSYVYGTLNRPAHTPLKKWISMTACSCRRRSSRATVRCTPA